jgi:chitinase
LAYFCEQSSVDIIPIAFVNSFLAQGDGYVGENFANACWGAPYPNYVGPGYDGALPNPADDLLPTRCPYLQQDIPTCQALGKKIVLSLGGSVSSYQLTGAQQGIDLANFLWGAYGPYNQSWVDAGNPRPLDRGLLNNDNSPEYQIDIDGFDFDIEVGTTGKTLRLD